MLSTINSFIPAKRPAQIVCAEIVWLFDRNKCPVYVEGCALFRVSFLIGFPATFVLVRKLGNRGSKRRVGGRGEKDREGGREGRGSSCVPMKVRV